MSEVPDFLPNLPPQDHGLGPYEDDVISQLDQVVRYQPLSPDDSLSPEAEICCLDREWIRHDQDGMLVPTSLGLRTLAIWRNANKNQG